MLNCTCNTVALKHIFFFCRKNENARISNLNPSRIPPKNIQKESMRNTDLWIYQRLDQVPGRSENPLLTSHTRLMREAIVLIRVNGVIRVQNQYNIKLA